MNHVLAFLAIFFCFQAAIAQKIQVLSQQTKDPILGVAVFNEDKSKSAVTNFDGFADISSFNQDEVITFQHIAHTPLSQTKSKIVKANSKVFLITDASSLDEVVLSVSKFGQKKRDIPQQIVSVTSEDVLFTNPQTAADLLQSSSQVYVQKSQLGGGSPKITSERATAKGSIEMMFCTFPPLKIAVLKRTPSTANCVCNQRGCAF